MALMAANETIMIQLLEDLIRINSVNPSLVPGGAGEAEIADYVAAYWRRLGIDVQLQPVAPGRPNVIAEIRGPRKHRSFLMNAHMDTVSVEGMVDPFVPRLEDGKVFGRGAMDTKGGLAAMLMAGQILLNARADLGGDVIFTAVVDEEYASLGTEALVKDWKADAAIVMEPTGLNLCRAHKGFVWLEVGTEGLAAHGSRPDIGIDAILMMGDVMHELSHLETKLRSAKSHPLLGTGSLHGSLISGGREMSSYPDRCRLHIERRTIPGETSASVSREIQEVLERCRKQDAHFRAYQHVTFQRDPFELSASHPLVAAMGRAVERTTGRVPELVGMTAWADSALLGAAGIPAVVFGPGGEGLHGLVEYVYLDQVVKCAEALAQSVLEFFTERKS